MVETLKQTDQRLVLAVGANRHRVKFILDKESGQVWFERIKRFLPSRTRQAALAEIAAVDAIEVRGLRRAAGYLVVTLKSGKRLWFATADGGAAAAATTIRSFVGLPDTAASAGLRRATRWHRYGVRGAIVVAVLALATVGAIRLTDLLVLPGCTSPRARDTVHDLLQAKSKNPIVLSDFATISTSKSEIRCSADIAVDGDTATVGYRAYWDGWTPMVRITGALGAARLDPERMRAIDKAYDDFMTLGANAYQTGNPPRQSNPAVDTMLTTIFDVLGLGTKTLAGQDIDEAIRWFNSGDTVGSVYLLAGTGENDLARLPQDDATQGKLRANVVKFSDEFGRYADFQVLLLGAIADAQASYAASGPPEDVDSAEFKRKVTGVNSLLTQALKTDFISLVYDGLADPWRLQRLDAMARAAPRAARVLSANDAADIRDQALQTLPYFTNDQVKARVTEVAATIAGR